MVISCLIHSFTEYLWIQLGSAETFPERSRGTVGGKALWGLFRSGKETEKETKESSDKNLHVVVDCQLSLNLIAFLKFKKI